MVVEVIVEAVADMVVSAVVSPAKVAEISAASATILAPSTPKMNGASFRRATICLHDKR